MPYHVVKQDDKYCVQKSDSSKSFGCHATRAEANKQMAALYVAEKSMQEAGFKDWELESAIYSRQVDQDSVNYNPLGADADKGCANCNWWIAPKQCMLVYGEISPTGMSDLWMAKTEHEMEPMPVVIVKADAMDKATFTTDERKKLADEGKAMPDGSYPIRNTSDLKNAVQAFGRASDPAATKRWITKRARELKATDILPKDWAGSTQKSILDSIKSFLGIAPTPGSPPVQSGISWLTKEGEPTRFFMWGTNNFKDRSSEILKESSHKDFVAWADEQQLYPELWLWHVKGTRIGQIDWMECDSGFLVSSGLVDPEAEPIVVRLKESQVPLGASHGFIYASKGRIIEQYRSWEFSVLPLEMADNPWTNFVAITKEASMGFSERKRQWLKDVAKVDDTQIKEWEDQTSAMSEQLKALGVEWKEGAEGDTEDLSPLVTTVQQLSSVVGALSEQIIGVMASIKELKETDDAKIASVIQGELAKLPKGFVASTAKETESEDDPKADASLDWFGRDVIGPLVGAKG